MYIIYVWHVFYIGWCWDLYSLTECILFRNKQPTTVDEYHMATGKPSLYQKPNSKNHEYVRVLVFFTQWRTIRYIHGKVIQISHIRKNLCLSFVHLGFQDIRLLELFVFWWVYPESWCHLPILFSSIYMAVHHSGLMHIYILNFFSLLLLLVCRYVDHGSFSSQCKSYLYLISYDVLYGWAPHSVPYRFDDTSQFFRDPIRICGIF